MKYDDFKIFKFSTILKSIDSKRYNFSRIYKNINFKKYSFSRIYKNINFKRYKYFPVYVTVFVVFSAFIYLNIPAFFNYEKSKLENIICKKFNIECSIQGEIKYSFWPSPRIKITNLIIQDFVDNKEILGKIENLSIKLAYYNLLHKNEFNFTKIELQNAEINIDLDKLKEYKNFPKKIFYSKPINLKKGEINFYEGKKNITTIRDVNLKYKRNKNADVILLKGVFLNDDIYINLKNKKNENDVSKIIILKFLDFDTKVKIFNPDSDNNVISGNISFRKDKNRLKAIFDYKNDKIIFKQANLRNIFLEGKFKGEVKFLPYFNFNLNVDLNSINFNKLYSSLIALDKEHKKNLFKINKKINGQLILSADKIFSKRTLIDSFESRIKFANGNISVDQLLLNLGKLGAADITGIIKNDKKFTTFKFENNIFFDNLKRFYNKFGIFNKQNIPSNLFISGNLDLVNLQLRLNEIFDGQKFTNKEVAYIEKEFNELVLEDGYVSLFNFLKLKEFVKIVTTEIN